MRVCLWGLSAWSYSAKPRPRVNRLPLRTGVKLTSPKLPIAQPRYPYQRQLGSITGNSAEEFQPNLIGLRFIVDPKSLRGNSGWCSAHGTPAVSFQPDTHTTTPTRLRCPDTRTATPAKLPVAQPRYPHPRQLGSISGNLALPANAVPSQPSIICPAPLPAQSRNFTRCATPQPGPCGKLLMMG